MKNRSMFKVLAMVIAFSMVCVFALTGCRINKKTPEEIFSRAMTASAASFEEKSSVDDVLKTLKDGLITVQIDSGSGSAGTKLYMKDSKIAIGIEYLKDLFGVDMTELKEKFPKSMFGTEGGNYAGFSRKDEQDFLDSLDKVLNFKTDVAEFTDELTKLIKENCTMTADYGKSVELGSGSQKADVLDLKFTAGQVKEIIRSLVGKLGDVAGSFADGFGGFDSRSFDVDNLFDSSVKDEDEAVLIKLYTDVKSGEILGGVFKDILDEENGGTVNFDVVRSEDSVKYVFSNGEGEAGDEFAISLSDANGVERFSVESGGSTVAEYIVDRNEKSVVLKGEDQTLVKFDYDVAYAADGSVDSFTFEIETSADGMYGGMSGGMFGGGFGGLSGLFDGGSFGGDLFDLLGSGLISGFYGSVEDYYDAGDDYGYFGGDYYDGDYDDYFAGDDYDDFDYDFYDEFETEPATVKITVNYSAAGEMPVFRDVLSLTNADLQDLLSEFMLAILTQQY
ncbi:MAG: hypothetical protein J5950_03660 [Clostridia bacterium]|nr:hypothetical protein [Clostridia bacterium]